MLRCIHYTARLLSKWEAWYVWPAAPLTLPHLLHVPLVESNCLLFNYIVLVHVNHTMILTKSCNQAFLLYFQHSDARFLSRDLNY